MSAVPSETPLARALPNRDDDCTLIMKSPFYLLAVWISSGFGSGYALVAPGTFGSAAALAFWWLLHTQLGAPHTLHAHAILTSATIIVGTLAVYRVMRTEVSTCDPQWIVIDEWAGLFLALFAVSPDEWGWASISFILFRIFDAAKPGPVGWVERLPGAAGIMADDLVAGALAGLTVMVCRVLLGI